MSQKDARFMQLAYEFGFGSSINSRHGCVAVLNGKVVSYGVNNQRCFSSDGLIKETWCCHAEVDAIRKLCYSTKHIIPDIMSVNKLSESQTGLRRKCKRLCKLLSRVTLYVARVPGYEENIHTQIMSKSSTPCRHCLKILCCFGIKQVAFITENNEFVKCKPTNFSNQHITSGYRSLSKKNGIPSSTDNKYVKICQA